MPPVVFPIGAYHKELAADHLDRLLGKSILDWFIHQSSVTKDGHTSGANQPENRGDGRGPDTQGHANAQQSRVELRSVEAAEAQIQVASVQLADTPETGRHKDDDEQQERVGQQAVDAEHDKDHGIVAREVGEVVVDTALDFTKVGGLGQALEVEELGNRPEVGEAGAQRLAADAVEAITETRGDRVNGDLDGHSGKWWALREDRGREDKMEGMRKLRVGQ